MLKVHLLNASLSLKCGTKKARKPSIHGTGVNENSKARAEEDPRAAGERQKLFSLATAITLFVEMLIAGSSSNPIS
jgi:hypothetical protein